MVEGTSRDVKKIDVGDRPLVQNDPLDSANLDSANDSYGVGYDGGTPLDQDQDGDPINQAHGVGYDGTSAIAPNGNSVDESYGVGYDGGTPVDQDSDRNPVDQAHGMGYDGLDTDASKHH
ncbi:hypothetical protein [Phormidesmis sp. 146-33]